MMSKEKKELKARAVERLRPWLPVGCTVYTTMLHVSTSGMSRVIKVIAVVDGKAIDISQSVADACGFSMGRTTATSSGGGVRVVGCGMDMGFHIVYALSSSLWPDGHPCTGTEEYPDRCPSNDHNNGDGDYCKGKIHKDGGYSLKHQWL